MKTIGLLLIGMLLGAGSSPTSSLRADSLRAEEQLSFESTANNGAAITVGEYVAFLRAVASQEDDFSQLYHDALKDQIDRIWVEDHFDYQVRKEVDENALLTGLSQDEVAYYYAWIENEEQTLITATDEQ